MAKEKNILNKIDKEKIKFYLPFVASALVVILFLIFIFIPQKSKLNNLSSLVKSKNLLFSHVESTAQNVDKLREEIAELERKIAGLEERLPEQIEAKLLIDTLKDITKEARIQFVSIEPKKPEKIELVDQQQAYRELPILVRLKCGYNELCEFIKKIENSKRLMKIRDLKIKANPQEIWEHNIELTISTFSTLKD